MASNGIGLSESIVFAPQDSYKTYQYRTNLGMFNSAEFTAKFDDFVDGVVSNLPDGWQAAIIDSGATVTTYTTATVGANGVLQITDATASEGACVYGAKAIQLLSGKKFFMEARLRTNDVTDNAVQFGLSALTAVSNPEDVWTTVATDVIAYGILDGSANLVTLVDAGNTGTSAISTGVALVADTWTVLGIGYDGANLQFFVDGKLVYTQATPAVIPTAVALAPFFGHINGNGAGGNTVLFDYIRFSAQR